MTVTREDNGWWADGELVVGADGDAVCECYWNAVLGGNNEPVEAEERAKRIARLPELEEATGHLLGVLAYIFADYDIMTDEDADDWPELREALGRVSVLLFPDEPEGEVEP